MDHLEWQATIGGGAVVCINNLLYIRVITPGTGYRYEIENIEGRTIMYDVGYASLDDAKAAGKRAAWDCLVTALGDLSGLGGGA